MVLWMFIFNHAQWEYLHSNCSTKNISEWYAEGASSAPIGILYLILGILCEVFFINKLEKSVSCLAYVYPINASHAEARIYTAFML